MLYLNKEGRAATWKISIPGVTFMFFLYLTKLKEKLLVSSKCYSGWITKIDAFHIQWGFLFWYDDL